jgi:predicted phosphoribosyltransferase
MMFVDRADAGRKLAGELKKFATKDCVVLAIPRGGVVLGAEVANELLCPLDLVITRKVGHQYNPEYALCVVAEDGCEVCNEEDIGSVDQKWLAEEKKKERSEAKRRRLTYLGDRPRPTIEDKTAIVVDDGVATGLTMIAALREVRELKPSRLVAAVPVMPAEFLKELQKECDEVVCLNIDQTFLGAVGAYYEAFPQVGDEEVKELLE